MGRCGVVFFLSNFKARHAMGNANSADGGTDIVPPPTLWFERLKLTLQQQN
jgi:hypothetical protein